ncbi:20837_t:CDS:2 [Dentiscutata erythropus]|uniref:20837_t:CDS:1 n=1 Tax=Dentiscutata erythropus TaxID=1348616 RepID=A0A9N9N9B7_9GLOM|nr:20837_t:CDS:2 [Dentiscutata erythropus]
MDSEPAIQCLQMPSNQSWTTPLVSGIVPLSRQQFQAVNDNGKIYMYVYLWLYIGGINVNMSEIPIYNTTEGIWSSLVAVGDTIGPRACHSAVLTPDGYVIVYGGIENNKAPEPLLATLDTNTNPYK